MKFFADTADLEEIKYCFDKGVNDGITTNPKIMESTGDLSLGFEGACRSITEKYNSVPVSLETDLRGIEVSDIEKSYIQVKETLLSQANSLVNLGQNVVVKIPICKGGLEATSILSERGIQTNVTACMTPYQALEAAKKGATYVRLFANRMLDSKILILSGHPVEEISFNSKWKKIVKENKEKYFEQAWEIVIKEIAYVAKELEGTNSNLIIGSIRSPEDIYKIVKAKPQVITIPTNIVKSLENIFELKNYESTINNFAGIEIGNSLSHPMTEYTLEEFERAADSYRK